MTAARLGSSAICAAVLVAIAACQTNPPQPAKPLQPANPVQPATPSPAATPSPVAAPSPAPAPGSPAAPAAPAKIGYDDTPMQPNGTWHVHDGNRPQPRVVTPVTFVPVPAPPDALVLLGPGEDLSSWQSMDGTPPTWPMKAGVLETGKGFLRTKQEFTDFQLHVEFATPTVVKGDSQGRGNSGVFLLGAFEIQVLDSYQNPTYPDGQASAMYGQYPPLVNASRPPGEWQSYDIVFTAPRFGDGGKVEKPAIVTVLHNGILVHNATAFWGPTQHRRIDPYIPANAKGPLALQDHGNPIHFRNIWIRPLKADDET